MVGLEQVYHSPVSQYGSSKPEVVNKNSEKLERMVSDVRFQYFGFGFQLSASGTQRTMSGFLCFNALQR